MCPSHVSPNPRFSAVRSFVSFPVVLHNLSLPFPSGPASLSRDDRDIRREGRPHHTPSAHRRAITRLRQTATMTTQCYGVDGTPDKQGRYIPCNITAVEEGSHSGCCAPGDNCLTNGLCQGQSDEKRKANLYWRNGCTDPTWEDAACARHCIGMGTSLALSNHHPLFTIYNSTICHSPTISIFGTR